MTAEVVPSSAARPAEPPILRLRGIVKSFGRLRALDGIDVDFHRGEVHAILGENGAGKSTLMNAIYGLLRIDAGEIEWDGEPVRFASPLAARAAGIGMVHQELALIDALTVVENLACNLHAAGEWRFDSVAVWRTATALAAEVGLELPPADLAVGDLPVGARQRLEILKALNGDVRLLILDEPTAVLTPAETTQLFRVLDRLRAHGTAVVLITHKLAEVTAIADRVTVLRRGRVVGHVRRGDVDEATLARLMVGEVPLVARTAAPPANDAGVPRLQVEGLSVRSRGAATLLDAARFTVQPGETFAIAGVDGNGQWELFAALVGLQRPAHGGIYVDGCPVPAGNVAAAMEAGIGHIPPDRGRQGLVLSMTVADNCFLSRGLLSRVKRGPFLPASAVRDLAAELVRGYRIQADGPATRAGTLSGGNQQRLVVARALAGQPRVLVAFSPTRGLDIGATQGVFQALNEARCKGMAIVLLSTDLDEVFALAHRVAVIYRGRLSEPLQRPFSLDRIGRLMAGDAGTADESSIPGAVLSGSAVS